ncbi:hypothetical protein RHGRI_037131 [Rhododendron griersonianum]|uniref:DUF4283 domain-containing protein n=1 Tax=Rhododendron griersonianum TaxID=479676 RepID=A0AAV6HR76_9ERIC|nr:hypothetical protein RHGRI_037131 [Rhododendron griersonianum]
MDYARICVEIDAGTDLPDDIQITINGEAVVVALQYQWLPPICTDCKVFGHPKGSCIKQSGTKVSGQKDTWQVVSKGKGKRDTNSADVVSGEASSSQSAIEDSNGNPSVLADLPNSVELQPITPSEAVASEDNGIVVKGPVVHALSNLDKGGQRAACEQSFQGQVDDTTGSDSDVELLEVLERVVSSNKVSENMHPVSNAHPQIHGLYDEMELDILAQNVMNQTHGDFSKPNRNHTTGHRRTRVNASYLSRWTETHNRTRIATARTSSDDRSTGFLRYCSQWSSTGIVIDGVESPYLENPRLWRLQSVDRRGENPPYLR